MNIEKTINHYLERITIDNLTVLKRDGDHKKYGTIDRYRYEKMCPKRMLVIFQGLKENLHYIDTARRDYFANKLNVAIKDCENKVHQQKVKELDL